MIVIFDDGGLAFEWDRRKAKMNLAKHGVTFEDAATSFADPRARIVPDRDHSGPEERWHHLAMSAMGELLLTRYTPRNLRIRIIFARPASRRERHEYFQGQRRRRRPR